MTSMLLLLGGSGGLIGKHGEDDFGQKENVQKNEDSIDERLLQGLWEEFW